MKVDTLELEIHTTRKEIKVIAKNEDILKALQTVIDVPDNISRLQLNLSANEAPEITFVKLAESKKKD